MTGDLALEQSPLGLGRGLRDRIRRTLHRTMPGRSKPATCPASPRRPILLLHGFASSPGALGPLERGLRSLTGRPIQRVAISPGLDDLRDSAHRVEAVLGEYARHCPLDQVDVVGHSMGGLVATYLLKRIDRGQRIRNVVTLGTPHRGSAAPAAGVMVLGPISRALWQILPESALIEELKWLPLPNGCQLVSIAGGDDALVPEHNARLAELPGHRNVRVSGASHWGLLFSRPVLEQVSASLLDTLGDGYCHAA